MAIVSRGSRMVWAVVVGVGSVATMLGGAAAGSGAHLGRPGGAIGARGASARLVYVAGDAIDSVGADGSGRRSLVGSASALHGGPSNSQLAFSRNGSWIVFVRGENPESGAGGRIWLMRADGSHRRRLATGGFPRFSPDGRRIVFVRELRAPTSRRPLASTELWVMNMDGSGQRRLTGGGQDLKPSWSPDGSMIAFQRTTDAGETEQRPLSTAAIWVMSADGSAQRQVTAGASDGDLVWSPDGSRIAFVRTTFDLKQRRGGAGTGYLSAVSSAIYEINPDGSAPVELADQSGSPAFSPGGSRIAFMSYRDRSGRSCGEDECSYNNEIYVMHSDGSGQTRLTYSPGEDHNPAWTPDGRAIVLSSDRANYPALTYQGVDSDLYIIPGRGGCPLRLTDSSLSVDTAAVAPIGTTPTAALHATCRDRAGYDNNHVRPEIATDETAAARHYGFPVFYLGDLFDGIMLTDVQTFRDSDPVEGHYRAPFFEYDRCAARPGCGSEVQLDLEPICKDSDLRHLFPYGPPDVITRRRGALVLTYHSLDDNQAKIYLGTVGVLMRGTDAQIARGVTLLRRFGQTRATRGPLPTPRLPADSLRLIQRIVHYRHSHNATATARRFHISPSRVRAAVRLATVLGANGTLRPSHC